MDDRHQETRVLGTGPPVPFLRKAGAGQGEGRRIIEATPTGGTLDSSSSLSQEGLKAKP
jgi:hypothetical protein